MIAASQLRYVHHMVLYECHVESDSGSASQLWFDHHATSGAGAACYSPNMPPEWTFCLATNTWAWVRTTKSISLPAAFPTHSW